MKAFEYAAPREVSDILSLLSADHDRTEILAGGTDLVGLMQKMIVRPDRVINIKEARELSGIESDSLSVTIGAVTHLDDMLSSDALSSFPAIRQALVGINSQQLLSQATLGGELCQRPRCWYFRNGFGLLGGGKVADGDNRHHAILGNAGPAKFVSPSRLAPVLAALGASVRIAGPAETEETVIPVEALYRVPRHEHQRETVLAPNQLVTHVTIPAADGLASAWYEVRHGEAPDCPLAGAAAALRIERGVVREARIVLGQVAPIPWPSRGAVDALLGREVTPTIAEAAGDAAVATATPLSDNGYKAQLARVAVKRAILLAAGLETGGL